MNFPKMAANESQKRYWPPVALFFIALSFYCFWLGSPPRLYWDETIHVNGARVILYGDPSARDYPPFGRELLLVSMVLFGDTPAGDRALSAIAGAGCIALIFLITRRLTQNNAAGWVACLALILDPLFYLHARMGMLDMFVTFFMVLAFWLFLQIRKKDPRERSLFSYYLLGFSLGLGFSIKAIICVLYFIFFADLAWSAWNLGPQGRKKHLLHLLIAFSVPTVFVLWLSYAVLGYSLEEIKAHLTWYYNFMSTFHGNPKIITKWYEWIFVKSPIWYLKVNLDRVYSLAVVAIGNHIVWFTAEIIFVALLFCWKWVRKEIYFPVLIIVAQFFFWGIKPTTHFYYMVPILPFYALLIGCFYAALIEKFPTKRKYVQFDTAVFLICSLAVFVYYFPLLSGRPIRTEKVMEYLFPGTESPTSDPRTSQAP